MDEEKEGIDLTTLTLELSEQDIEHLSDKDGSESLDVTKTIKDRDGKEHTVNIVYRDKIDVEGTDVDIETEIENETDVTPASSSTEVEAAVQQAIDNPEFAQQESVTIASFDKFLKLNS